MWLPQQERQKIAQYIQQRKEELTRQGIREPELTRVIQAEIFDQTQDAKPWPPDITGVDLAGDINNIIIPDTGFPPIIQPNVPEPVTEPFHVATVNPYPNNPTPDPIPIGGVNKGNADPLAHMYSIYTPPNPNPSDNWTHNASSLESQPSLHGREGWVGSKDIPE